MHFGFLPYKFSHSRVATQISMIVFKLYRQNLWPLSACWKLNFDGFGSYVWMAPLSIDKSAEHLKTDHGGQIYYHPDRII